MRDRISYGKLILKFSFYEHGPCEGCVFYFLKKILIWDREIS